MIGTDDNRGIVTTHRRAGDKCRRKRFFTYVAVAVFRGCGRRDTMMNRSSSRNERTIRRRNVGGFSTPPKHDVRVCFECFLDRRKRAARFYTVRNVFDWPAVTRPYHRDNVRLSANANSWNKRIPRTNNNAYSVSMVYFAEYSITLRAIVSWSAENSPLVSSVFGDAISFFRKRFAERARACTHRVSNVHHDT